MTGIQSETTTATCSCGHLCSASSSSRRLCFRSISCGECLMSMALASALLQNPELSWEMMTWLICMVQIITCHWQSCVTQWRCWFLSISVKLFLCFDCAYSTVAWHLTNSLIHVCILLCVFTASCCASAVLSIICLSVCMSQVWSSTMMAKPRITQTTPYRYGGIGVLVFWCQRSWRNSSGVMPSGEAKYMWGTLKSTIFVQYLAISQKRCKIEGHSYYRRLIVTRVCCVEWRYFQWLSDSWPPQTIQFSHFLLSFI